MNISDTTDKNEQLFWNVIHNKYLFNLIFEKIHEISNEIEQTHNIKSYKYKDIKSMSWMIRYGAFNLLNYKLSKNDEIKISEYCIQNMVSILTTNQFDDDLIRFGIGRTIQREYLKYEIEKLESNQYHETNIFKKSNEPTKMLIYQTIELLLKNYRSIISRYDIIISIFEILFKDSKYQQASLELIRTLVCEPYSIVLTPYHFKLVILNFNLDFIKEFIDIANQSNCNIVDQDFKDRSLSIILNKKNYYKSSSIDQKVLKFILDNPQYHSQSYDPKFTPQEIAWDFCGGVIDAPKLDLLTDHDIGKRDIITFFSLDQELQIKLLSLKYYNTYQWFYYESQLGNMVKNKSKLRKKRDDANKFIYKINCKRDHLDPISKINAIKDFFKDYIQY